MKIVSDTIPAVCNDCIFCRGDGYAGLCCTLLNKAMPRRAVMERRFSGCPLIHVDEIFNRKFGKESVANGERKGTSES